MARTIDEAHQAFEYLYTKLVDKSFAKTLGFESWGERELLPAVRTYLLGYFKDVVWPEEKAKLPGVSTGHGRIDFLVGEVAVEFAVRKPGDQKNKVLTSVNETEVKKLLKYPGKSLLVLFDFSDQPLEPEDLEEYRELPSLGQGNHNKSPFQVSYFYSTKEGVLCHRKQIRVR